MNYKTNISGSISKKELESILINHLKAEGFTKPNLTFCCSMEYDPLDTFSEHAPSPTFTGVSFTADDKFNVCQKRSAEVILDEFESRNEPNELVVSFESEVPYDYEGDVLVKHPNGGCTGYVSTGKGKLHRLRG